MIRPFPKALRICASRTSRFRAANDGVTAVEFALIAPVFLAVLVAILETAIFLFAQATLQTAAMTAGRLFMTGKGQTSGMSQTAFKNSVCPTLQPLFDCNKLMVDVRSYASFIGADASTPTLTYDAAGNVTNTWSYDPGSAGDVVVVRLMYQYLGVGAFGFSLSNLANGSSMMMGVTAFRVEPY